MKKLIFNSATNKMDEVALTTEELAQKLIDEELASFPHQQTSERRIELLEQENEMLNMSVMELSNYAAEQDTKIQTQEDAIMELSMFIMGGN